MTTTTTTIATATMFIAHGSHLEVYDPARNNGLVVVTTISREEKRYFPSTDTCVVACKRHHVVYDPGAFVALEIRWGYEKLTGRGWDWWGRMKGIVLALVKGAGGAIATTQGGGSVELKALVRKADLAKLARLILAIGVPSPITTFQEYLEGLGLASGVAEYWTPNPRFPEQGQDPNVIWLSRSWPVATIADNNGEKEGERTFSATWECQGRNVFVREIVAGEQRYGGGEPLAVLPAKWFGFAGSQPGWRDDPSELVEIRLGTYAEQVSGEGRDRTVLTYPLPVAIIPVAKYEECEEHSWGPVASGGDGANRDD